MVPKCKILNGNTILIKTIDGLYLQSYDSVVAHVDKNKKLSLGNHWDYSMTTIKNVKKFIDENSNIEYKNKNNIRILLENKTIGKF